MPITKQAKKKQRRDIKARNRLSKTKSKLRLSIKTFKSKKTAKNLSDAFKLLDKAAKTNIIHKNKASRLKSRLSKQLNK